MWRDVPGFSDYLVSNKGRVKSKSRKLYNHADQSAFYISKPKILKPNVLAKGYLQVYIKKENKRLCLQVHRLVAMAFLDNLNNYPQVNHINCEKWDNRVENLEWCNNSMNQIHAWRNGLQKVSGRAGRPKRKVAQFSLDGKLVKVWDSIAECARAFGNKRNASLLKVINHYRNCLTFHGYKFDYYDRIQQRQST